MIKGLAGFADLRESSPVAFLVHHVQLVFQAEARPPVWFERKFQLTLRGGNARLSTNS
jgi:hypothetical protein